MQDEPNKHRYSLGRLRDFSTRHAETHRLIWLIRQSGDVGLVDHIWEKLGAPQTCPGCQLYFWPAGREKYCCGACRQRAYRQRHPELREKERKRARRYRRGRPGEDPDFW